MNRINTLIENYSMNVRSLLDTLWSNAEGFVDLEFIDLYECLEETVHKISDLESIRDAIRRPSR